MTLQEIKENWNKTDEILYIKPEIKFKCLEQGKTKVIAKQ